MSYSIYAEPRVFLAENVHCRPSLENMFLKVESSIEEHYLRKESKKLTILSLTSDISQRPHPPIEI